MCQQRCLPLTASPINRIITLCITIILLGVTLHSQAQQTGSSRLSLDEDWLFHLGDIPFPPIKGHGASYMAAKAGVARGAAAVDYDDSEWRLLSLPHDWAMEHPVDSTENIAQGYRKRGFGWYRKRFKVDAADKGKQLELQFEGIATHATIWVNGQIVHRSWSAYNASNIDITAIARYGDEVNTIAIRVDAEAMEGWWYEGAGIYRHTWLVKRAPVYIATDGVFAHPVHAGGNSWMIPVEVTVFNSTEQNKTTGIAVSLFNSKGQEMAKASTSLQAVVLEKNKVQLQLQVEHPELWTLENPALYTVKTRITAGAYQDEVITRCGFRTIRFTADSGFYLNNRRIKIKGVCNHIDHAGVGTAVPDALWLFRLQKIKEMGANAYRCSHNAPSARLLDLCDSLGILVMDENRNFNAAPEYLAQLEWLVRRDRNHPSVILWSVFNEEPIQGTATGYEMVRRMAKQVKMLDTTRPVTAAMNGGFFGEVNVSQAVDVTGFNYEIKNYDKFHELNPHKPATSSEDASAVMIRGEYVTDKSRNLLGSYDTEAPSWGSTHRTAWRLIDERPWLAGAFVWTGFDYHGEPTPFIWPSVNSSFGIVDICGFPKEAFYLRQAQWIDEKPILHLAPHWNWPKDSIGKLIKVMAFSNADRVKLLLNGKQIADQPNDRYEMLSWMVPYKPGKLEAIGYKNGRQVSTFAVETTGVPVKLRLTPDRTMLDNDGRDAMPVTVEALDEKGRHVPDANLPIQFVVSKTGTIIGLGNGNPNSHEPEKGNSQSLFNGLAQVIIQSAKGQEQDIELTATAPGLSPATIRIPLKKVPPVPVVAYVPASLIIDKWRMSPVFSSRPDPNQQLSDNDMNSWSPVQPGKIADAGAGGYVVYRAAFTPYAKLQKQGGKIEISKLTGEAEIWINGKQVATKTTPGQEDLTVRFPAGENFMINILMKKTKGQSSGLNGIIKVSE